MKSNTANYNLKITDEQLNNSPSLGASADFQALFALIQLLGALGSPAPSQQQVANQLYDLKKIKPTTRFENLLRGHSSVKEIEMGFFRDCLKRIGSENLVATISDDEILLGKAHNLIRKLLIESPNLDWDKIDPLNAILSLCVAERHNLFPSIEDYTTRMVQHKEANTSAIEHAEYEGDSLKPGHKFFLHIETRNSLPKLKHRPLILNFTQNEATHEDGRAFRGMFLYPAREFDDLSSTNHEGNCQKQFWRSSNKRNKPWVAEDDKGHFGFLILGNAGECAEQLLPHGADPLCVSNSDLQYMFGVLIQSIALEDDISFGVLNYRVE